MHRLSGALFARHERLLAGMGFPVPCRRCVQHFLRTGAGACGERPLLFITRLELKLCRVPSSGLRSTKETRGYCGGPQG